MEPLDTMDKVRQAFYYGRPDEAELALWVASYGFTRLTGKRFSGFGGGEFLAPGNMRFEEGLAMDMEHCLALNALYKAADPAADPVTWAKAQLYALHEAPSACSS